MVAAGYTGRPAPKVRRPSFARQAQRSTIGCGSLVQYRNEFNRSGAAAGGGAAIVPSLPRPPDVGTGRRYPEFQTAQVFD
jgi:hypothetical protein